MITYSKKIIQFIQEIERSIREIVSKEVLLEVGRNRFYHRRASYPIHVVIYNNKKMLGYFDPNFYELGFHECLTLSSKKQLGEVIRHELAHYLTFIEFGEGVQSHGAEFRSFCQKMGWGEEVYRATTCLDGGDLLGLEQSGVLRKVQKLMALSSSSSQNEAEQAMTKSQQLLLKHNIDSRWVDEEERMFLKRIRRQKREDGKMRAIAKILETFFVSVVFNRAKEFTYLEVLGNGVNVEIAEYVAEVLDGELDSLWNRAQQQAKLKGMVAKNSFFLGVAKGYCNKIKALKRDYGSEVLNGLMILEKKLIDAREMAYPRLFSAKRSANHCRESSALGEQMGRKLKVNPAIDRASDGKTHLKIFLE